MTQDHKKFKRFYSHSMLRVTIKMTVLSKYRQSSFNRMLNKIFALAFFVELVNEITLLRHFLCVHTSFM